MTKDAGTEGLLRELAPRALGAIIRRYGDFADAEDAVQEALLAAAGSWRVDGVPASPLAWMIRVASRHMAGQYRTDEARRRREDLAASWSIAPPDPVPAEDDTLVLMFMCCHPSLTPLSAIPLTLRAVGGLTTREIAAAFLVPEATMAQRISRAKAKVKLSAEPFTLPSPEARAERLRSVLHVLYLLFNEGYASSSGPELTRTDLSGEGIRLARAVHEALPDDPEVSGLLALMLLTDARRPARSGPDGELVPLAEQDRSAWDRGLIAEGVSLVTAAIRQGQMDEYQVQAAIAAVHDQAARYSDTNWSEILALYGRLERMTGNPMVTLNRAVAAAMVHGPARGLALLDQVGDQLGDHHRRHSVRAHLLELAGDTTAAVAEFRAAAARTSNLREQQYLTTKAARLASPSAAARPDPAGRISIDDPAAPDVHRLLERHLAFANSHSPPEDVHALDAAGLSDPAVTFFSFRLEGELLGVGALKMLDAGHAEVKSMHTAEAARGRGIGRAMLDHLVGVARDRGVGRVSLETGSMDAFAPARCLYAGAGFRPCPPFGDYRPSPNSTCMTMSLDGAARSDEPPTPAD